MLMHATIYQHVQAEPSNSWVIEHNLSGNGSNIPVVDVFIDYAGELRKIIPASVSVDSKNQCTVLFSTPVSGYALVMA